MSKPVQVCSEKCGCYLTSNEQMPIELDVYKNTSRPLKILSISSNGISFCVGKLKSKVLVQLLKCDKPGMFMIMYSIHNAYEQAVVIFYVTDDFLLLQLAEGEDNFEVFEEVNKSRILAILSEKYNEVIHTIKSQETETKDQQDTDGENTQTLSNI